MKRNTINFILDCISALAILGLIGTGIVIRFALPPGSGMRRLLWALTRHEWGDVHFWLAVAVVIIAVVHVALHWTWVVSVVASRCARQPAHAPSGSTRFLAGIAVLTMLTGLVFGFRLISVGQVIDSRKAGVGPEPPVGNGAKAHIQGSMTIGEVSQATGLPVQIIRQRLRLSDRVRETDKLGQLSHEYGFTLGQARQQLANSPKTTTTTTRMVGHE